MSRKPLEGAAGGGRRAIPPLLALVAVLAGCGGDTTELIGEINAAREGCTEEMLKAADEECVQMFERYAEMGEDAIETYIGGMRALDEALRRRGGVRFDTAGLGRALSDPAAPPSSEPAFVEPAEPGYFDGPEPSARPSDAVGGGSWEDEPRGGGWTAPEASAGPLRRPPPALDPADRDPEPIRRRPDSAPSRGRLLPPEDRLRRPWIGDEEPSDPYLEEGDRRSRRTDPRAAPDRGSWSAPPEEVFPPRE